MTEIVLLSADDAGEILTLQRAAFAFEVCVRYPGYTAPITQTLQELHAELSDKDCLACGIRDGDRLVACVRIRHTDPLTAYVARLAVAPDRTQEGLGAQLMTAVEHTVRRHLPGVKRLELTANGEAAWLIGWYERIGFHVIERGTHNSPHEWRLLQQLVQDQESSLSA